MELSKPDDYATLGALLQERNADVVVMYVATAPDVSGEELGVAGLQAKVRWGDVTEEVIGMGDDLVIDGDHSLEVVEPRICADGAVEAVEPVEAPFKGSDDAIRIAGSECRLPGEHPLRIKP